MKIEKVWIFAVASLVGCSTPPPPEPVARPQVAIEKGASGTVRVTATALNVRADATTSADVVAQVRRGTRLTVIGEKSSWLHVRLTSGEEGWVSAQHITRDLRAQSDRAGCPSDTDFSFVTTPVPSFSESGPHGLVVIEANVSARGDVTSTRVISNSTGDPTLAARAEKEIRATKFSAPIRNCAKQSFIYTYKRSF